MLAKTCFGHLGYNLIAVIKAQHLFVWRDVAENTWTPTGSKQMRLARKISLEIPRIQAGYSFDAFSA